MKIQSKNQNMLCVYVPIGGKKGETGHAIWWELARQKQDIPQQLVPIFSDEKCNTVWITIEEWDMVKIWCQLIPHWDNGRWYGCVPLVVE